MSGFIYSIKKTADWQDVYFYIARKSDHKVYMPISGTLLAPRIKYGQIKTTNTDVVFKQDPKIKYDASITWEITPTINQKKIYISLFVGKPRWISDSIQLEHGNKDIYLGAGALIGEILIGSMCILRLPTLWIVKNYPTQGVEKYDELEALHQVHGDEIIGGITRIGILRA